MLPTDIERLIMEFHDEYDIITKRFHLNLVFKTAFREFKRQQVDLTTSGLTTIIGFNYKLIILLHFLKRYDRRLQEVLNNTECYSKLWTGVVPWD